MPDQRESVVQRMIDAGESEDNIASVIREMSKPTEKPWYRKSPDDLQTVQRLRADGMGGMIDGAMSGSMSSAAPLEAGKQGVKMIQGLARRLYGGLLKPKQGVKDSFGNAQEIAETLLGERAAIGKGGLGKVTGRLGQSRDTAMAMVKEAEDAGMQGVVAKDVIREYAPVVTELRKRVDIGKTSELQQVGERGRRIVNTVSRHAGDIPLTRSQALKETAQDAASGAYRVRDSGAQKVLSAEDLLDEATARGFRKGIERKVPGVGPQNTRTQKLLGGKLALEDAVEREANNNMFGGGRDWATMGAAGLGGVSGGPVGAAASGALMRLLATPSTGSRVAIGMNEASKLGADDALERAIRAVFTEAGKR